MIPPKIVVFGNTSVPAEQFTALSSRHIEVMPIPDTYPADCLQFLAPFHLIVFNSASESEENLERIRTLRRAYRSVPVIMASVNPSIVYLVEAYRYGITDCLLAPFSQEKLASLVSTHLQPEKMPDNTVEEQIPEHNLPAPLLSHTSEADLHVQFLGTLRLNQHGSLLDLPGGARQRSLLAYLLYHTKTQVPRDRILQYFWPDHDPDCAKNNLNVSMHSLRRHLSAYIKEETICYRNDSFFINPNLNIYSDLDEFLHSYHLGKTAERHGKVPEAISRYLAVVQMGYGFLDEFGQEEWTIRPREEFIEKHLHALGYISANQQQTGNFDAAIESYRQMLSIDGCLESVHRGIMVCYLALGKKEKAVRQFLECERVLQEELDMRPSAETQALYQEAKG